MHNKFYKYKIVKINYKYPKSAMHIFQSRQLQSSPTQLLNFLLNTAKFSDFFKLSGNACQSSEPRNDTDSIPYVVNNRLHLKLLVLFSENDPYNARCGPDTCDPVVLGLGLGLGTILSSSGSQIPAAKSFCDKTSKAYFALRTVLQKFNYEPLLSLKIFNTALKPILMYRESQPEYKFYCKCHDEQFHFY